MILWGAASAAPYFFRTLEIRPRALAVPASARGEGAIIMADRVSVSITIGGDLAASMRYQLVDLITDEGLSTEWDGPAFDAAQFPDDAPLMLYAHEVAWGRLDGLKAFCLTQALPFVRWSGGYPGQFGPERAVFTGAGEVRLYAADEEDYIVICLATDRKSVV